MYMYLHVYIVCTFQAHAVRFCIAPAAASISSGVDVNFSNSAKYGKMTSGCHSNDTPVTACILLGIKVGSNNEKVVR